MVQRISFCVHGHVQGVSYRYFTRKKAKEYHITGWVRNAAGGKVEGEAQGDGKALQELITHLEAGPTHATVERVDKTEAEPVNGESGFEVRV